MVESARALWKVSSKNFTAPEQADRMNAILTCAVVFLISGIPSIAACRKPVFGPVLPLVMEAEREKGRDEAWERTRAASQKAVRSNDDNDDDDDRPCDCCSFH